MKKLLLFISALFVCMGMFAQTIPYTENFESYTVGGFLAVQSPTNWTTWSNLPGSGEDATISSAFASSPTKSVLVENSTDLILKLGNKTTGKYDLMWKMYVETGKGGYYNVQHFQSPGIEYAYEVYFLAGGTGRLYAGSATVFFTFNYPKDTWFDVKNVIDVDNDLAKLYVNGILVHQWPFHYQSDGTTGTNQLGGVDFFAGAVTGETPKYFFDDLVYQYTPTILYSNGFDTYALDSYVAINDPTWFTTWGNAPGGPEDAIVKNAFSHSPSNSALVENSTDLILKLGNKVSGVYDLRWWTYIETGKAGYYNIQHFQSPGTEFASEVFYLAAGTGTLKTGNVIYTFNYPKDTWFEVQNLIDLDADLNKLYINGVLIHQWPFHYQATGTVGTKQLGGVDFYAGANGAEIPKYYFDDVYFAQMGAPSDPIIGVTPISISDTLGIGQSAIHPLTISNTGPSNLNYTISVIMNNDGMNVNPPDPQPQISNPVKSSAILSSCSSVPTSGQALVSSPADAPGATAILHYDSVNTSAVRWNTRPVTVTVAARFPNPKTLPYAGMMLESVDVYVNQLNTTGSNLMTVKIFGMGTSYEPGSLLTSQNFTPAGAAWEHIVLTSPVLVTGQDLWIGYTFTQTDSVYIPGTDAGPNDPNGDFLSTGVGWSHLSPGIPKNWNIRGNLNGTPFPQWLTVAPMSGTVTPNGSNPLAVTLNAAGLVPGAYQGIVRIWSNDPVTPQQDVPVTLTVVGQLCDPPTGVAVTNVTGTTANVGWVGAPWVQIDYGPAGHTAGTGTIIPLTNTNPYPLTGLTPLTSYTAFVRQDCGAGNFSPWVGPIAFTTPDAVSTTIYPVNSTGGTGYVSNGSFLKKGPWMNCAAVVNDTIGRGFMKFDISSLPVNAIITKATLNYYNFFKNGSSTAINSIYPLALDPVTTAGFPLHLDCMDGMPVWADVWSAATPVWYRSVLNANGTNYLMDQLQSGWAGFGFPRTSTALFRFAGYDDATYKPYLQLEYHVSTTPILSLTPSPFDFEQVNLGIQSIPQTFKIKNSGSGTITINAVYIDGVNFDQYILTGAPTSPITLGPGISYTVQVVFKPTTAGVKTANLKVTDSEENEYTSILTGTGYLNGPQNLTATPVIGPYVNLAWEAPLPLHEIRYDNNTVSNWLYWGPNSTTNLFYYTKITIPANGTLTNIGVLTLPVSVPTTWQSIRLCPDNGGIPNLAAPVQSFTSVPITKAGGQWILKSLTPYPVTAGQTYYIVTQWPTSASGAVAVGTDAHNNHGRCASSSTAGALWTMVPYNYIMRAYMTVAGDNSSNQTIELVSGIEVQALETLPLLNCEIPAKPGIEPVAGVIAPAVVATSNPNRSFTNYTLHRGTVSGTYDVNIPGLSGTTYQDVTTAPTTTYYYMLTAEYSNGTANSNEASVTTFEVCPVPTSLAATGITTTSANLGWNGNGTVAWEIEWGLAGFVKGTGTVILNVTTNPYALTGLSIGTAYGYYVRSKCSESSFSSWAGPFVFATLCPQYAAPFTEDFELALFPPLCWSKSTATFQWARVTTASGYGVGSASTRANFYNFNGTTPFNLMTLNFNASGLYQPKLKFDYAYATYTAEKDSLKLYYSTNAGTTWTLLQGLAGGLTGILNTGGADTNSFIPAANQWATYTIALPAGANMVRFTGVSAWGNNLFIDNVKVVATVVPMGLSAVVTDVSCIGASDGAIGLTVTGGVAPYAFQWNDGSISQNLSNLGEGIYNVTVTDFAGASATGNWTVNSPTEIFLNPTVVAESCPDANNGSISLAVTGGTPPYSYQWSNGATSPAITGLGAGSYSIIVTDFHYCMISQQLNVDLASNVCPELIVSGDVSATQCFNATQTIFVAGAAGAFNVFSGGSATFIAGQKIIYYPGTKVYSGGYMHGYIAPVGPWCPTQKLPSVASGQEELPSVLSTGNFNIYPNPTNGNFTIVQKAEKLYSNVKVEIYGMNGAKMITAVMIGEKQHEFSANDLQSGLYFVKIIADDYVETIKLVKTR